MSQSLVSVNSTGLAEGERLLVVFLLDHSGSMGNLVPETDHPPTTRIRVLMETHNRFLSELLSHERVDQIRYARSFFNNTLAAHISVNRLKEVKLVEADECYPHGDTALLDAIGNTIQGIEHILAQKPHYRHIYLVIMTDGKENASRRFSRGQIRSMIKQKQQDGWVIEFFGASADVFKQAQDMGIPAHQTQAWDASSCSTVATHRHTTVVINHLTKS